MTIRNATAADLPFILEGLADNRAIEQQPPRNEAETASLAAAFRIEIDAQRVRVLCDGDEAVGFLCVRFDKQVLYVDGPFLWIDLVYVRSDCRGRGFGQRLYEEAARLAREHGCTKVVADVFASNTRSMAFHEKMGFRPKYTIYEWPLDS